MVCYPSRRLNNFNVAWVLRLQLSMERDFFTLSETNSSHLKMVVSNRNLLFQGSIFRCYVSLPEGKRTGHRCHPFHFCGTLGSQELSLWQSLKILLDVASGMRYLHEQKPCILHRDSWGKIQVDLQSTWKSQSVGMS